MRMPVRASAEPLTVEPTWSVPRATKPDDGPEAICNRDCVVCGLSPITTLAIFYYTVDEH